MLFKRFIHANRPALIALVVLSAATAGTTVFILAYISKLAARDLHDQGLGLLVEGIAAVLIFFCVNGASQYLSARLGARLAAQLRSELSQAFLDASYEKLIHQRHPLLGFFINDIGEIASLIYLAPLLAYNILATLASMIYLLTVSTPLFGIWLAGLTPLLFSSWVLTWRANGPFDELRRAEGDVFENIQIIQSGKKELSLSARRAEHFSRVLLHPSIHRTQKAMAKAHLALGLLGSWTNSAAFVILIVVAYASYLYGFPAHVALAFLVGTYFMLGPLGFLLNVNPQIARGLASLRNIDRLDLDFSATSNPASAPSEVSPSSLSAWRHLHAEGLCYKYPTQEVEDSGLGPISLELWRGEILFIVGGNGAGKSTLLLLLCSLLTPSAGELLLDGKPVDGAGQAYMDLFSGVFGDFFLFRHILDGAGRSPSDVDTAVLLRRLRLADDLQVCSGELSRVTLSAGQRKRAALLQCLTEDRDIFLFDEWAADQDPEFKRYFYEVMLPELKHRGKTLIVISHDDRYFGVADRILKLENGRVAA